MNQTYRIAFNKPKRLFPHHHLFPHLFLFDKHAHTWTCNDRNDRYSKHLLLSLVFLFFQAQFISHVHVRHRVEKHVIQRMLEFKEKKKKKKWNCTKYYGVNQSTVYHSSKNNTQCYSFYVDEIGNPSLSLCLCLTHHRHRSACVTFFLFRMNVPIMYFCQISISRFCFLFIYVFALAVCLCIQSLLINLLV